MSRLLLLMTTNTYRAAAFLEAAARLETPVVVGSERPQILSAVDPARHLTLDFSEPAAAASSVRAFARGHPITGVVAADDEGVMVAAEAAAALGLRHNPVEAVSAARDKHRSREIMAEAGLNSPHFRRFSIDEDPAEISKVVAFPAVLKPLSLSASRGVIRADDPEQFVSAFHRIGTMLRPPAASGGSPAMLVESFIPGFEVALEGLLSDGELRTLALFDKPDPLDGPFFEETIYVTPSRLASETQGEITDAVEKAARALGLRWGPVHAEVRVNERGAWILEIAARSIGGLCSRTLRFESAGGSSGRLASLEEVILRQALDLDIDSYRREGLAAGVMMIPIPGRGVLREVRGGDEARRVERIEDVRITIPVGQEVVPLPEGSRYLGFIFARGESPSAVEAALREAHHRLTFVIAPPKPPPDGDEFARSQATGRARASGRPAAEASWRPTDC